MATQAIPTKPRPPFLASDHQDSKKHLLLATTGSVATIKLPQLLTTLSKTFSPESLTIHLLLSPTSKKFLSPTDLHEIGANPLVSRLWSDADEWAFPSGVYTRECPVLHIELRKWADVLVVAPLSANTLSSIVVGRCDGLLLSVLRAWDWAGRGGVVVAPAMNTLMWTHPVTAGQVETLRAWGVEVLMPASKMLACGDEGVGGMVGVEVVVEAVERRLGILPVEREGEKEDVGDVAEGWVTSLVDLVV